MKIKEYTEGALVVWRWSSGWDAVYASKKTGRLLETRPIIGWAVVGITEPGRKNPVAEVHGIRSVMGNEFLLAGWERSFLGYERSGANAVARFGAAARACRRSVGKARRP